MFFICFPIISSLRNYRIIKILYGLCSFIFMFRHPQYLDNVRERSWSWFNIEKQAQDVFGSLTFNENINLSLTSQKCGTSYTENNVASEHNAITKL